MADREQEREHDRETIDHAIDKLVALIDEGEVLKGCAALVPLLERRAKLLGLDATPSEATGAGEDKPGSIASVERRLGLVAK